ncbi:MAG: ABC transporter permease, partial [Oscillospiraceae bacterium]|nr:ABC transporter permease [Oscillospiraceae bacterium]
MIWENIRLAIQTLRANKMRALLTMLGIIIGIMSIIGILMIGDAMTASISGDLSTLGTDNITLNVKERGAGADSYISNRIGNNQSQSDKVPATGDLISDQMISDLHEVF